MAVAAELHPIGFRIVRERPLEPGDGPGESGDRGAIDRGFQLAGLNGVEVVPASAIELPEFDLGRRSRPVEASPRADLRGFDPARAGLPETTMEEAPGYIQEYKADRPWLRTAHGAPVEVQRVLVALDKGTGHALDRHEGAVTAEALQARVTRLEDPAQLDPAKREMSRDAYKSGVHRCDVMATHIWDPDAFATAFVRGTEDPRVRRALEAPFDPDDPPGMVKIEIEDLLGPDGHEFCSGYRLEPVNGDISAAIQQRKQWVDARRAGVEPAVPEPQCQPIETFKGGLVAFSFRPKPDHSGYEVSTMLVEPQEED